MERLIHHSIYLYRIYKHSLAEDSFNHYTNSNLSWDGMTSWPLQHTLLVHRHTTGDQMEQSFTAVMPISMI